MKKKRWSKKKKTKIVNNEKIIRKITNKNDELRNKNGERRTKLMNKENVGDMKQNLWIKNENSGQWTKRTNRKTKIATKMMNSEQNRRI